MSNSPHNETPPARWGDLWHRLWPTRAAEQPGQVEAAVTDEALGPDAEVLAPVWDTPPEPSELDTAKLEASAAPTESMERPPELAKPQPTVCPVCSGHLSPDGAYCVDCGLVIPAHGVPGRLSNPEFHTAPSWHERYLPRQLLPCRPGVQRWVAEARQVPDTPKVEVYYSLAKVAGEATQEEIGPDEDVVNLQAPLEPTPSQAAQQTLSPEAADWPGAKWLLPLPRPAARRRACRYRVCRRRAAKRFSFCSPPWGNPYGTPGRTERFP